jgi:FAD/FMN-containing dehydrogenase
MTTRPFAVRPGDAEYDEARTTVAGVGRPHVVFRAGSTHDVVAALRHAAGEGLQVAIRSGGHSSLGFGNVDHGAVLDLSRLDEVVVLDRDTVRIGAGFTWGHAARGDVPAGAMVRVAY